jgi:hypothetical protein
MTLRFGGSGDRSTGLKRGRFTVDPLHAKLIEKSNKNVTVAVTNPLNNGI